MLTIFSTVKPFEGRAAILQRNAIMSWTLLRPRPEVIVFGDEQGVSELCAELGLRHVPQVARNEFGTPLVSDLLAQTQSVARGDTLCYVNGDIVLMDDFVRAVQMIRVWRKNRPFLAIGTRWNVWIHEPIDFSGDWDTRLRQAVKDEGEPGGPWTMDYFAFPRSLYGRIPPFAVGRPYWDDWMVYSAWKARAAIVDVTPLVTVVHQRHDYGHYRGGQAGLYSGEEARRNRGLAGPVGTDFGLRDATHVVTARGVQPAWRARGMWQWLLQRLRQRVVLLQELPSLQPLVRTGRSFYRMLRRSTAPLGWTWPAPRPSSPPTMANGSGRSVPRGEGTKAPRPSSHE